jgi:hypothetical protein
MVAIPRRYALLATSEEVRAVLTEPGADLLVPIAKYVESYLELYGRLPHGLHYLPAPVGAIWIPPETSEPEEALGAELGVEGEVEGSPAPEEAVRLDG